MVVVMSDFHIGSVPLHIWRKKRSCPKCGNQLKVVTEERAVGAPAADGRRRTFGMKSYETRFVCSICRLKYTDKDLKLIEIKSKKRENMSIDDTGVEKK